MLKIFTLIVKCPLVLTLLGSIWKNLLNSFDNLRLITLKV